MGSEASSRPSAGLACLKKAWTDLQPHYDQVPETDHAELCGSVARPRFRVLYSHDVHEVEDELHRQEADDKPGEVHKPFASGDGNRPVNLRMHHERVGGAGEQAEDLPAT